jgi:succinoglycan biosynthesis protein ExoO
MPVYNRGYLISRAIESVKGQTLASWQLVTVDDASSDETVEIARTYAAADPRIEVLVNERNMGVAATRNRALRHCTGRFVTPLDSDDWYHPKRLEILLQSAELLGAQILSGDLLVVRDGEDRPVTRLSDLCNEPLGDGIAIDMPGLLRRLGFERDGITLGLTKPLIDRQFLMDHGIEYDTRLVVGEDYWLLADCVATGASFVVVPDALYYHRLHAQQTTKTTDGLDDLRSSQRRLRALLERGLAETDPHAAAIARYHPRRMDVLEAYGAFVTAVKQRRPVRAATAARRAPSTFAEAIRRAPLALERRRRARRGDPFAYDQLFGPHLSRRVRPVGAWRG